MLLAHQVWEDEVGTNLGGFNVSRYPSLARSSVRLPTLCNMVRPGWPLTAVYAISSRRRMRGWS